MPSTPTLTADLTLTDEQLAAVRAADDLFTEHGITPIALDAVATQAGLSSDILAEAFSTKRELLVAVLTWKHQGWARKLESIGEKSDDPRDEILGIFSYLEECFSDTSWRGCCFINAYGEVGRDDDGIAGLAEQHFSEVERHIGTLCARAGLPSHLAETLTLLIQGARAESGIHHTVQPARAARMGAAMLMSVYQANEDNPDFF